MKKLVILAALLATPALAQDITVEQLDAAKRAVMEKEAASRAANANAADVSAINVRVDLKVPNSGNGLIARPDRQQSTDVVIHPSDPEFDAVLAAAKAAYARKAGKAQEDLDAVGIERKR